MVSIDEIRDVASLRRILFAGGLGFECNRDMTPIPNRRYDGKVLRSWNLWLAGRRARDSTHLFRECERLWSADTFVDFSDGLKTAGSKLRIAPLHYSSEFSSSESSDAKGKFDSQAGSKDMHGDATLRPVWHTFRVDASFDKQQGITGIGLILRATNKAGREGAVVARFSESYIGLPIQAGEQFAVLRALEIAFERGYRLLRVRSDYNQMRIVLKDDYQAGVVQEHNLRGMILRLARKFDQIKFAWIPRRRNQEAHFLARKAVLQSTPVVREDVERFFESGSISKKS